MKTKLPSTPAEFIQWVGTHINAGDKYFWDAVDKISDNPAECEILMRWRDSVFSNTAHPSNLNSLKTILLLYRQGCDLFGKEEFEHDMQQFYDDNI